MKRGILSAVAALVAVLVIAFGLELLGLEWTRFFAPKRANVQRQVFEQTQSHTHGMVQQLARYKLQYDQGDATERAALKTTIATMFAHFDANTIENEGLRQFLTDMRGF